MNLNLEEWLITPPDTPQEYDDGPPTWTHDVSRTFHRNAPGLPRSDIVLVTLDGVLFYACMELVIGLSPNAFSGALGAVERDPRFDLPAAHIPLQSAVLNVVLHAMYGLSPSEYAPDFAVLSQAVDSLVEYAVDRALVLHPPAPLFAALIAHAPSRPLDVYTLAARHDIEPLAVAASRFLLSYPLARLSEHDACRIGGVYLRRLFFLHLGRVDALKRLLVAPPRTHPPTTKCDSSGQDRVKSAWTLTTAYLLCDLKPDMTPTTLHATLRPLLSSVWCAECRTVLSDRIDALVAEWSAVKNTI